MRKADRLFDEHFEKDKSCGVDRKEGNVMKEEEGRWQGKIMLKDEFLLFAEIYLDMKTALMEYEAKAAEEGKRSAGKGAFDIPLLKRSDDEEFGSSNLSDEDDDQDGNGLDPAVIERWRKASISPL